MRAASKGQKIVHMDGCVFFRQYLCLDHDQVLLPNRSASRAYKSLPSSHQSVFQARDSAIPLAWPDQHLRNNSKRFADRVD